MKVTLDLDKLLAAGKITKEEYERLAEISRQSVKSHTFNVLIVLASIAVVAGLVGMFPEFFAELAKFLVSAFNRDGIHLVLVLGLLAWSAVTRGGFQAGLSSLVILNWLGGSAFYSQGGYFIAIREPAPTVLIFSALSLAGLAVSRKLAWDFQRLALVFSRTCLFIVNMGFWVGSIWGSPFMGSNVPDYVFAVFWALSLLSVALWAAREGRLFVVNLSVVFGSIHFYTQWFERLGANPGSMLAAGAIALLITYYLQDYNRKTKKAAEQAAEEKPA
ncbi:MAG: hypothetical protein PHV36_03700 [Elusimicrobiales bacterium]|nr:hypothetical protein [Elusimicrobiales bacterium]